MIHYKSFLGYRDQALSLSDLSHFCLHESKQASFSHRFGLPPCADAGLMAELELVDFEAPKYLSLRRSYKPLLQELCSYLFSDTNYAIYNTF